MNNPALDPDYDPALAELSELFGDRLLTSASVRAQYQTDESFHTSGPPHAVIQPLDKFEIQQIVTICAKHSMPVVPRGAGTSLEGNCLALNGGICIDTVKMNSILTVNHSDFDVVVQDGAGFRAVVVDDIYRTLYDVVLYFFDDVFKFPALGVGRAHEQFGHLRIKLLYVPSRAASALAAPAHLVANQVPF